MNRVVTVTNLRERSVKYVKSNRTILRLFVNVFFAITTLKQVYLVKLTFQKKCENN